jgi:hypothetical protein
MYNHPLRWSATPSPFFRKGLATSRGCSWLDDHPFTPYEDWQLSVTLITSKEIVKHLHNRFRATDHSMWNNPLPPQRVRSDRTKKKKKDFGSGRLLPHSLRGWPPTL